MDSNEGAAAATDEAPVTMEGEKEELGEQAQVDTPDESSAVEETIEIVEEEDESVEFEIIEESSDFEEDSTVDDPNDETLDSTDGGSTLESASAAQAEPETQNMATQTPVEGSSDSPDLASGEWPPKNANAVGWEPEPVATTPWEAVPPTTTWPTQSDSNVQEPPELVYPPIDSTYPATVSYDEPPKDENLSLNSEKSWLYFFHPTRKLLMILLCLLILVLTSIIVGVVVGRNKYFEEEKKKANNSRAPSIVIPIPTAAPVVPPTSRPTSSPSNPPTENAETRAFTLFASAVGDSVYEEGTKENLAARWMLYQDPRYASELREEEAPDEMIPLQSLPPDDEFLQRYLLVFFYYAHSADGLRSWRSCNPPADPAGDLRSAKCTFEQVVEFDGNMTMSMPVPSVRWLTGAHECNWAGVTCETVQVEGDVDDERRAVFEISLAEHGLVGTLVTEILALPYLRKLTVPYNDVVGTIPVEYNSLNSLELQYNSLSGTLPNGFFDSSSLTRFDVTFNDLTGTLLDTGLGQASSLELLSLSQNNFAGPLFGLGLGQLPLVELWANRNAFTGLLPIDDTTFFDPWATSIKVINLEENMFSGPIPPLGIGQFIQLERLSISNNKINGTIPEQLYNLPQLTHLYLDGNTLQGTISPDVAKLQRLQQLIVSENQLSGTVVSELASLPQLTRVELQFNLFDGTISDSVCNPPDYPSQQVFVQADCAPFNNPSTPCICCRVCCDRETETCVENRAADEPIYLQVFEEAIGSDVLVPGSAQQEAAFWIVHDDPARLSPNDPNLLQRFILALLYLQTSNKRKDPWAACNPPKFQDEKNPTCMLRQFDDDGIPGETISAFRWLSGAPECEWSGIICDINSGEVTGIGLSGQKLTGTLPTEISVLPKLELIAVPFNELNGTLPLEYGRIPTLKHVLVQGNSLTGTIPLGFFGGDSPLLSFDVGANKLIGTVPTDLSQETTLETINVFSNSLTGSLPEGLTALTNLRTIRMSNNQFSGTIPLNLFSLSNLEKLALEENQLYGTLPGEIAMVQSLKELLIADNAMFGVIPSEVFDLQDLEILRIQGNEFVGTISTEVGQLTNLQEFRIENTKLTGTIPSELGRATRLETFTFYGTTIGGVVPIEICELLLFNELTTLQADCDLARCTCCTQCISS